MDKLTKAYERGRLSGVRASKDLAKRVNDAIAGWKTEFPSSAKLDLAQELIALDKARLNATPSLVKFPETRGWADIIAARRKGFQDATGVDALGLAYFFNAAWFVMCRLMTRHLGAFTPTSNCTAVFIRDSREGGPLYGRNWDMPNIPGLDLQPPRRGPDGVRRLWSKGVSCGTMCDEEPTEIFPINAWEVLPEDCRKLPDVVAFLTRYVEFWSPHNGVIVDEDLNSVAFEKSTCRVGWRYSPDGSACVTACAQIIPEMKAHRDACHAKSLKARNFDHTSPDWHYWTGCEKRYHRLMKLVSEIAGSNPSLEDLGRIMTDHAVPYPDRVCISGGSCHPDIPVEVTEWTMRSRAAVLHGPNRRTLFWRVEGKQPCYENPPFLIPGDGVAVKDEWREGTRPIPPITTPDDALEDYRQYEFDYPMTYPN
jgi:hypothetical protein